MNKPEISIIIVGYNAAAFLKLTLFAVKKSIENLKAEVIFIDNSNNPELVSLVATTFPFVHVIGNNVNLGFGGANNLGLRYCKSDLALLLNPDTIITESALNRVIQYYRNDSTIGGIGLRMINGTGSFLRESKRGFPDIFTSFCKFSGLAKFFPNNTKFTRYYAGHIGEFDIHKTDILAGAFMTLPRLKCGDFLLFDTSFFMYGEDVDLSYRLQQNFGENIYIGDESIIHFKGKSTEASTHIIYHFFHSMWIFYKLHIKPQKNIVTNAIVYIGIKGLSYFQMFRSKYLVHFNRTKSIVGTELDIRLISNNQSVRKYLSNLALCRNINISTSLKIDSEQLIIFDLNFINQESVISFMQDNCGKYKFGFLTHDYSHLIMSESSFDKGQVYALK